MNLSVSSVLGVVRRGTRHLCAVRLCLLSLCLVLCAHGGRLGVARPRAVSQRASAWVWRWELGVCDCVEYVYSCIFCFDRRFDFLQLNYTSNTTSIQSDQMHT